MGREGRLGRGGTRVKGGVLRSSILLLPLETRPGPSFPKGRDDTFKFRDKTETRCLLVGLET